MKRNEVLFSCVCHIRQSFHSHRLCQHPQLLQDDLITFECLAANHHVLYLGRSLYNRYGPSSPHFLTFTNQIGYVFQDDAWVVINGEAIDVTKWISIHPGGEQAIMAYLGKDRAAAVAIFLFWLLQIGLEELN